jgi:glycosyltransferase involved in cell wall biosynthesis
MNQSNFTEISDPSRLPSKPLVSVCVLAYRHEKFISQAIDGIVMQRRNFPIEIVIGEDCSPDNTLDIIKTYQQRHPELIRVITSDTNVGSHANGKRIEAASRGKYIAYCEGDDYWHDPCKLQMQADLMESNPNMSFVHTDFDRKTRFRVKRRIHKSRHSQWLARGDAYEALLHEWTVMTVTTMYRASVLSEFRGSEFDNRNWPFGDRNRLLFASLRGTAGYIDASTAAYRKVRGSAANKDNSSHLRMKAATLECIDLFLKTHPIDSTEEHRIRASLIKHIYVAAFLAEREDVMRSEYQRLRDNGHRPSSIAHYFCIAAVRLWLPARLIRSLKNFITSINSIPY